MDPELLKYYNRELQFIRESGSEFAKEFPKIAGRLGIEDLECADPYVERLLEGFSFLAARVQLRLDAQFPRFTQHLFEMVYPHYLAPTPSMAVVQLNPDLSEGALAEGFTVPRESVLRSVLGKGDQTPCEYRTAHDVTLWPVKLLEVEYITDVSAVTRLSSRQASKTRAAIRLRLQTTAGLTFDQLALDKLPIFLKGTQEVPMLLFEQLLANAVGMVAQPAQHKPAWQVPIDTSHIRRMGFEEHQALLPYGPRSFSGYRFLHEYFALPERYMFVELGGLQPAVRKCNGTELDIIILLDTVNRLLENKLDDSYVSLFATPAINLFPKRADRIHMDDRSNAWHIVPDRTRPIDFEVYQVTGVTGHGSSAKQKQAFQPFYAYHDTSSGQDTAYYTLNRERRMLSSKQRRVGPRSSYIGSEMFISLVDGEEAPYRSDLRQLGLTTLCTNRDLPLHMSTGRGKTDFTLESGAPVESVRCMIGPTRPRASAAEGETAWRLINHLSLNYLSITDSDENTGAAALRELLGLYSAMGDTSVHKQIEGLLRIQSQPVVRRIEIPGAINFGRGLQVKITCDESAFEGAGVFLFGAVMDEFFAKYVSINSFTETVVETLDRGEIMTWPARIGRRQTL